MSDEVREAVEKLVKAIGQYDTIRLLTEAAKAAEKGVDPWEMRVISDI